MRPEIPGRCDVEMSSCQTNAYGRKIFAAAAKTSIRQRFLRREPVAPVCSGVSGELARIFLASCRISRQVMSST
jgi:hypothetical protein